MRVLICFAFILITAISSGQTNQPNFQSDKSIEFSKFLSGVKYAYISQTDEGIKFIKENPNGANAYAILGLITYLKDLGFEQVEWGYAANAPNDFPSLCDQVIVIPNWDYKNYTFFNITLNFISCKREIFTFNSSRNIRITGLTRSTTFYNTFFDMYNIKKGEYNLSNRRVLGSETTEWSEDSLKNHLKINGADPIEGIYESTENDSRSAKYKIGIIKTDFGYSAIYFSGSNNFEDWKAGELKAKLFSTATPTLFKADWYMANKQLNKDAYITFEQGLMNLNLNTKNSDKTLYIKLFPSSRDNISISNNRSASGTGFAITSDGLIVTNHHVINGSKSIQIKGIKGDFDKSYSAKVVIEDKNNDLAILKINDPNFSDLDTIPFTINNKTADVGSSIFVLGYPLRSTMGDEVKLTDGVISSKSGFQGDVTSYQISAPIQPGNSGGPLFDKLGNLVGIINAKHLKAENASYAIKSSYLLNLLELMNTYPKLQTVSAVSDKPLTEQVKILKKFTYIIEVN
jgi:S1-C subfamily serine protease